MNRVSPFELRSFRLTSLAMAAVVAGCGSGGGGDDGGGADAGGGGGGDGSGGMLLPNFDSIQTNVFDARCIGCHIGATAPLGLRLDDANSYALLVGVASVQEPGLLRVDPGNPDDSYLIRKLEGTASTGGQMPLDGTPLSAVEIATIRQWIVEGAQRMPAPPPTNPVRVTSMSPLPDSSVPSLPMTILAVFDRELNASSVDVTTFTVQRSGGDGTFGDGNEVDITPVSVTVPLADPMTAIFDMSATTPVNDTYRVTLVGTGAATIQDLDANALDGEFSGTFPSGDGTAGGNFEAEFVVDGIAPTLQSIQDNVFTPICSACHTGPAGSSLPSGMDLTSLSMSFTSLVNVASVQDGSLNRVEPGDPDASYLIRKLEGTAATGGRMPLNGTPLSQETIDAIRQWISDGAAM